MRVVEAGNITRAACRAPFTFETEVPGLLARVSGQYAQVLGLLATRLDALAWPDGLAAALQVLVQWKQVRG